MTWPFGLAIFMTMWWLVLFTVLPFGVRSQHEDESYLQGTDPGAPVAPRMWWKALWTTLITSVLFAVLWWFMHE